MPSEHSVFRIGRATITQLRELDEWVVKPTAWFPTITDPQLAQAYRRYPSTLSRGDGWRILATMSNYVIKLDDLLIVVDTGIGNDKSRPGEPDMDRLETDYLDRFARAGFDRMRVDLVVCTHLHPDHCGWNTLRRQDEWVPTYPRARYLFYDLELQHIRALANSAPRDEVSMWRNLYDDSVTPILDQAECGSVTPGEVIAQSRTTTVALVATPGHTPGHMAVEIRDGPHAVLLAGDAFHHPLQLDFPRLPMFADADTEVAAQTRAYILQRCAEEGTRLFTGHFHATDPVGVTKSSEGVLHWKTDQFG